MYSPATTPVGHNTNGPSRGFDKRTVYTYIRPSIHNAYIADTHTYGYKYYGTSPALEANSARTSAPTGGTRGSTGSYFSGSVLDSFFGTYYYSNLISGPYTTDSKQPDTRRDYYVGTNSELPASVRQPSHRQW